MKLKIDDITRAKLAKLLVNFYINYYKHISNKRFYNYCINKKNDY